MSIAGSGPKPPASSSPRSHGDLSQRGHLSFPESRVQKGDSHYVDKKTRANPLVFLGLYFMSCFLNSYLFALPLLRKCRVNRFSPIIWCYDSHSP